MNHHIVIPARRESTRLPNKPLLDIAGVPMIVRVVERAQAAKLGEVAVATDDAEICDTVRAAGGTAWLTARDHASGSDRIAEVVAHAGWPDDDIVINVQGDEPLIPPDVIRQVGELLQATPAAGIATLATPILSAAEFADPNVVKVVCDAAGFALYFSRAGIPFDRAGAADGLASAQRHLGLYAYRVAALREMVASPPATLEEIEKLEQLRALALGVRIVVDTARELPGPGVDTPEDLARVRAQLSSGARKP